MTLDAHTRACAHTITRQRCAAHTGARAAWSRKRTQPSGEFPPREFLTPEGKRVLEAAAHPSVHACERACVCVFVVYIIHFQYTHGPMDGPHGPPWPRGTAILAGDRPCGAPAHQTATQHCGVAIMTPNQAQAARLNMSTASSGCSCSH